MQALQALPPAYPACAVLAARECCLSELSVGVCCRSCRRSCRTCCRRAAREGVRRCICGVVCLVVAVRVSANAGVGGSAGVACRRCVVQVPLLHLVVSRACPRCWCACARAAAMRRRGAGVPFVTGLVLLAVGASWPSLGTVCRSRAGPRGGI